MSGKNKKDGEIDKGAGPSNPEDPKAIYNSLLMKLVDRTDVPTINLRSLYEERDNGDSESDESGFEEMDENDERWAQEAGAHALPARIKPKAFTKTSILYKMILEKAALRRALAEQERAKNDEKKEKALAEEEMAKNAAKKKKASAEKVRAKNAAKRRK